MITAWWRSAVIYQIYPWSFRDTNGDGIGDLRGVACGLEYLVHLGIDAIWLSPIYRSPMTDFGYDVSDYRDIDPRFGTLADFDELLTRSHALGIKVILDLIPNHTSDQHPWFIESRASRENPKRDWYIWRDTAPDGGPPNNWISDFGGQAWQWDATTRQYYYHAFLKEQPDLNWRNEHVRRAIYDVMRFWFDRGVDGFRIDVFWHLIKAAEMPDNPPNPNWAPAMGEKDKVLQLHSTDQPEVLEVAAEMRAITEDYSARRLGDRVLIGEIYLPVERLIRYYGVDRAGLHAPANFQLLSAPWRAEYLGSIITAYDAAMPAGAWPNWVLGNHDRARVATRVGDAQARVAAMLLLTLRGMPTLYYGDELGMKNITIPSDRVRDPLELREPGLGRDPVRAPMPWDESLGAGFGDAPPWLPLPSDHATRNVAMMMRDPASILTLYRRLLMLRRSRRSLLEGEFMLLRADDDVLTYIRTHGNERTLVALNLGAADRFAVFPGHADVHPLLSTAGDPLAMGDGTVPLRPNEGVILGSDT
jgi:alpha-glucosidase